MQDNKAKLIGLVVIALLAVGGTGAVVVLNKQETSPTSYTTSSEQQAQETETSSNTSSQSSTSSYKDGSYSADDTYRTPDGNETISVDITLKDNIVTAVTVEGDGRGESAEYQSMFKENIASQVVGKNISELNVSRVSGSSLTSTGFNNALDTIRQQAQV